MERRLLVYALAALTSCLGAGCDPRPEENLQAAPQSEADEMRDLRKEAVAEYYRLVDRGEFAEALEILSDDAVWHFGGQPLDKENLLGFAQSFRVAFPDGQHQVVDQYREGDYVTSIIHFRGIQSGELQGTPASGNQVSIRAVNVSRLTAEGKIAESETFIDMLDFMRQIDALPSQSLP